VSFKLPALRSLHELADREPILVYDTREQDPLEFTRLRAVRGTLTTGDYSIAGLEDQFSVERKSISDLVSCCTGDNRARFERELHRLRGMRFKRLLIIGTESDIRAGRYYSGINPASVLNTLYAFEVRYCPVVFCPTPQVAAQQIERWAHYFCRQIVENANNLWRGTVPDRSEERQLLSNKPV
jgi:DNA excision repair protein ERCC-4